MSRRFKDSLVIGSTEDFDMRCDPCNFTGQLSEAKGFCVHCLENLCKRCLEAHKKTRTSRHHQILDQPQKPSKTDVSSAYSMSCSEYCNIHSKDLIKFYCPQHDRVGCTDCMTLDHRTCRIDYIPDICSGVLNGKEFDDTLRNVSHMLQEAADIEKKAQKMKDNHKAKLKIVISEIETFQKNLNDRIELLKQQLVKEASTHKLTQDQNVEKSAVRCIKMSSKLKQIETDLQYCHSNNLTAKVFVTMKQAQYILNSTNVTSYDSELTLQTSNIIFEPNDELKNIIFQRNGLGTMLRHYSNISNEHETKLQPDTLPNTDCKMQMKANTNISSLLSEGDINVSTKNENEHVWITGCAVLSADRLLLADCTNSKLKVVNTATRSLVEEMTVDSPFDITVLPQDQAAVTTGMHILIVETAEKLSSIKSLQVDRFCKGIVHQHNYLYVVCQGPKSLLVLNMQGKVLRDIPLKKALNQTFSHPDYIALSKDGQSLYIADGEGKLVVGLTLDGIVTCVCKHTMVARGMVCLDDGSLLVCCGNPGTIRHISADLKLDRSLADGLIYPQSICYDRDNSKVYVGCYGNREIHVYSMK